MEVVASGEGRGGGCSADSAKPFKSVVSARALELLNERCLPVYELPLCLPNAASAVTTTILYAALVTLP